MRFLKDAIQATRRGAGAEMIVGVRLSGEDKDYTENDLNQKIVSMLDWVREFVINNAIKVLAGDVILGERGEFILVETSTYLFGSISNSLQTALNSRPCALGLFPKRA